MSAALVPCDCFGDIGDLHGAAKTQVAGVGWPHIPATKRGRGFPNPRGLGWARIVLFGVILRLNEHSGHVRSGARVK